MDNPWKDRDTDDRMVRKDLLRLDADNSRAGWRCAACRTFYHHSDEFLKHMGSLVGRELELHVLQIYMAEEGADYE